MPALVSSDAEFLRTIFRLLSGIAQEFGLVLKEGSHLLLLQDDEGARPESLSPGRGRQVQQGVLGNASNREPSLSPARGTPRTSKRKKGEVRPLHAQQGSWCFHFIAAQPATP